VWPTASTLTFYGASIRDLFRRRRFRSVARTRPECGYLHELLLRTSTLVDVNVQHGETEVCAVIDGYLQPWASHPPYKSHVF
jgi:hypothetical protein